MRGILRQFIEFVKTALLVIGSASIAVSLILLVLVFIAGYYGFLLGLRIVAFFYK